MTEMLKKALKRIATLCNFISQKYRTSLKKIEETHVGKGFTNIRILINYDSKV